MTAITARIGGRGLAGPVLTDITLTVLATGANLLIGQEKVTGGDWRPLGGVGYLLVLCAGLPTLLRRRAPLPVLVVVLTAWTVFIAAGYWPVVGFPAAQLALYTVAAYRPLSQAITGGVLASAVWFYGDVHGGSGSLWSIAIQSLAFCAATIKVGNDARRLAQRGSRMSELAEQLQAEQRQRAHSAVVEERLRIARELHDASAHHLTVIAMHAGLARYLFTADPETAQSSLQTIADAARQTLDETRRLLTMLRIEPDDEVDHPAQQAGVEELCDQMRAAGLPVELTVEGERRRLPPGPALCVYRIVQESLTNVVKHAGSAPASVAVRYDEESITVRIADTGPGPAAKAAGEGPGHGLIGMAERARIYGGSLSAGAGPGGGFEVVLALPAPAEGANRPAGEAAET